ncbi:MAG: 50S ribosomal protein L32 [Chloroflexi bacterium]|jgi:large subunit ribosomal protein L32|nr:50S ribosomal protein L32 [Chloroflexota bacterium]
MGVPKRRVSHARQGDRRSHHAISVPLLGECSHCREQKQIHHACLSCGYYGDRQAVRIKQRTSRESSAS